MAYRVIVALVWSGLAVVLALVMGSAIHLADVLEARELDFTDCTNPLSHPIDACARRNGGQL